MIYSISFNKNLLSTEAKLFDALEQAYKIKDRTDSSRHYVYIIKEVLEDNKRKAFYVGTTRHPILRWQQHVCLDFIDQSCKNSVHRCKILDLAEAGKTVEMRIVDSVSNKNIARKQEELWADVLINDRGRILTNLEYNKHWKYDNKTSFTALEERLDIEVLEDIVLNSRIDVPLIRTLRSAKKNKD